jgi:ribonuclease HI
LWRGLCITKEEGFRTLIALGDSMLVIKAMIDQANPRGNKLSTLISRIIQILSHFDQVSFYHIKRELNGEADHWTKVASSLSSGLLIKNGVSYLSPIP